MMDEPHGNGMSLTRYTELVSGECDKLTDEEIESGWYFDSETDYTLMNENWTRRND